MRSMSRVDRGAETFGYTSSSKLQPVESSDYRRRQGATHARASNHLQLLLLTVACGLRPDRLRPARQRRARRRPDQVSTTRARSRWTRRTTRAPSSPYKGLESRYPFAPETRQAQLDLIYLYYKGSSPSRRSTPPRRSSARTRSHPRIDYCMYMRGRVYFDQEAEHPREILPGRHVEAAPEGHDEVLFAPSRT